MGPCYSSLLGVVCDVISDAVAEEEEAIGWMFPSSGPKKGSIARAIYLIPQIYDALFNTRTNILHKYPLHGLIEQ